MSAKLTREGWLALLANKYLWPLIVANTDAARPTVRYSIGFPKATRGASARNTVGQCFGPGWSTDGTFEIFVSPFLDAPEAAHTLLHEMIHATVGLKHKHRGPFKKLALAVGLVGPMTATVPGKKLKVDIKRWIAALPEFPGAPMKDLANAPKQTTRMIKCACPECGYTVRTTARWLEIGAPICPEHSSMEVMV